MKLKYYMRGLGIGIVVTALIMGLSSGTKTQMTDAEVMARAKKLGMISGNNVLLSSEPEKTEPEKAEPENEEPFKPEPVKAESVKADREDTVSAESPSGVGASENVSTPEENREVLSNDEIKSVQIEKEDAAGVAGTNHDYESPAPEEVPETVQITVASGNGSDTVSRKLADAGLVDNAAEFDKYLCDHNYDNKITVGKHTIPAGSAYEEIAKILTSAAE